MAVSLTETAGDGPEQTLEPSLLPVPVHRGHAVRLSRSRLPVSCWPTGRLRRGSTDSDSRRQEEVLLWTRLEGITERGYAHNVDFDHELTDVLATRRSGWTCLAFSLTSAAWVDRHGADSRRSSPPPRPHLRGTRRGASAGCQARSACGTRSLPLRRLEPSAVSSQFGRKRSRAPRGRGTGFGRFRDQYVSIRSMSS